MAAPKLKMRLGDLLVHEHIITNEQLMQALNSQKSTGRKLGDALIELGYIGERQLLEFLAQQLGVPFLDISQRRIPTEVASLLPEVHARRLRALIIEDQGDSVLIGMSDPADLGGLDQLEQMLAPKRLKLAVVMESQLFEAFDGLYRRTADIESFASQLEEEYDQTTDFDLTTSFGDEGGDATVGKLLQSVFEDAIQMRASDIHIEPDENQLRIRQRIDGVLQENVLKENKIASAMVLRLKLMAGLDISEKRLPQDGRFNLQISGHNVDVRISTMPVQHGESVVMRLLDQTAGLLTFDETGMPDDLVKRIRHQISRPHGMVLVTGPTGSGKTTTLYAGLSELNQSSKKIITVEDPVEYRLPRVNQVQVNSKIDLTFSSVLRTALRQDPDIIMIGEMRDKETVEIGLRGALTGHLVLSTLHTNDAITSALRLIDMGAAGFLVGSSLRAVIAQRLVRRVCDSCAVEHQPDSQELLWLTNLVGERAQTSQFKQGKGCQSCQYTGYKGRIGVFELLEMNEPMMAALKRDDAETFAQMAKENPTFTPLAHAAFDYATQGITSIEEVLRLVETVDVAGVTENMAAFVYVGRDAKGSQVKGKLEAANTTVAAEQLARQQIIPISIEPTKEKSNEQQSSGQININELLGFAVVSLDDLIVFCRQMYALMRSGVPILRAINGMADSSTSPYLKSALMEVSTQLEGGYALSTAMNQHPKIFPPLFVSLIHVGENTGKLDDAFMKLASYFDREQETRKRIKTALRYPSFVLGAIVIAMVILNIFVVPTFADMFTKLGADLPLATKVLITSSNFFLAYWPHMLVGCIFIFFGIRHFVRTDQGRYWWDKRKTRLPVVGSIIERSILSRFAHSFAIVLRAGVPMTSGLNLVSDAVDNSYMRDKIITMRKSIESGESLLRSSHASDLFTPLVLQMVAVGEETGRVDELLEEVGDYYEREVDYELGNLTAKIEPIMIAIVAAMVLVLALGIFTPMWDMMSAFQGK